MMHSILYGFTFAITFSGVLSRYKNFDYVFVGNPTQFCLTKILQHQTGRLGTTYKVIVEKNSTNEHISVLQDKIIQILNDETKWLLETTEIGVKQFEFSSSKQATKLVTTSMVNHVFLLLGALETFEEKLEDLLINHRLYRGFKLIVLLLKSDLGDFKRQVKHLMKIAWERKLFSTTIITQTNVTDEWQVYETNYLWSTDKTKRCIENIDCNIALSCTNNTLTTKRRVQNYWYRKNRFPCTVDVISYKIPPFVVNKTEGFEIKMLKTLAEHINVNLDLMIEEDGDSFWGEWNKSDGSWSGRLGQVEEKSGVAVGNLEAMPDLDRFFEFSEAYYYDKMVWVVPVAELAPRWMCIFMPFSYQLWLFMILIFIAGGVLLRLSYNRKEKCIYRKLERTLFVSLEAFLAVGTKHPPITRLTRSFFVSLSFCSIFFCSVYQGSLIDVLTHPIYQHQIHTLEEIVQSDLNIGGFAKYKEYFNVSKDQSSMKIFNMFQTKSNANVYDWLKIVAQERNVATLSSQLYVKYLIASGDSAVVEDGFPKIYVLDEIVVPIATSILMPRGFLLKGRINRGIENMITNGVAVKLSRNAKNALKKYESKKEAIFSGRQVLQLTMDNLQGAFVLLVLGYFGAIVMLFLELVFHKFDLWNRWMRVYKIVIKKQVKKIVVW